MDKNMDNDLSDIMREIEALEQDFKNEEKALAQSPIIQELAQLNEELSAPVGQKTEASSEDQTFDWLQGDNNKAEPLDVSEAEVFEMKAAETTTAPAPAEAHAEPVCATEEKEQPAASVTHITPAAKAPKQEWTPSSTPKMTFKLPEGRPVHIEFQRGAECLNFSWTEEGFQVEVEGGMSFTIPYSHSHKKVA